MESNLAHEYANQRASGVATAAEYIYAKEEIVGTTIIAVSTPCSLLSPVSELFLGAEAKWR